MNVDKIRADFPVLSKGFAYLDSACMALKPRQVVEAMNRYYLEFPACGERSSHRLGAIVTEETRQARKNIAKFINAGEEEIVFTKNTTEGLNLAANSLGLTKTDSVIVSEKEHNSNFLPWAGFQRAIVKTHNGFFDLEAFEAAMNRDVKVVAVQHTSNIDGMSFPLREISKIAHDNDALLVVDGAQSVPHKEVDVKKLNVDVLAFSGHKMLGPSIGAVYIKKDLAERMKPFIVGGGTVLNMTNGNATLLASPEKFEGGLQNYAGAIGLAAAVEYLERAGLRNIEKHEIELNKKMTEGIEKIEGVTIFGGSPESRGSVLSINIKNIDSREAGIMFDSHGVLVRGGAHCCHHFFNERRLVGSVRASLYLYNNEKDADMFIEAVKKVAALGK